MVKRQLIDVLLPFILVFYGFLLIFKHLIGNFCYFWRQKQDSCCFSGQSAMIEGVRAGATPGVYVYVYVETHRSGKLSVNHKGN